jgi:hypothetical protein
MIEVPTWERAKEAVDRGDANPLELFVYHNEPAGRVDEGFRKQLNAVIGFVCGLTTNAMDEMDKTPITLHIRNVKPAKFYYVPDGDDE